MFEIIEEKNDTFFGLLDVRFNSLRPQTYFDKIDSNSELLGYIKVSDFPSITMRIKKSSDIMLEWWKEHGKDKDNPPYPYIVEVASELFVRDNGTYKDDKYYSDVIFAKTEDELHSYIKEAIEEYNNLVLSSYCRNDTRKIY